MKRIWNGFLGLVMICSSLMIQAGVFILFGGIAIPSALNQAGVRIGGSGLVEMMIVLGLFLLYNGVSCFDYFRRNRMVTRIDGPGDARKILVKGFGTTDLVLALYLVPRGMDRIATGMDLGQRMAGLECSGAGGATAPECRPDSVENGEIA